jgi:hypothetical protein
VFSRLGDRDLLVMTLLVIRSILTRTQGAFSASIWRFTFLIPAYWLTRSNFRLSTVPEVTLSLKPSSSGLIRFSYQVKSMMTISSKPDLQLKLCFTTFVLFLFVIFLVLNDSHLQHKILTFIQLEKPQKEMFIEQTLNSSIDGDYDGRALSELCMKTNWTEGLIFSCYGLEGGLGNVRNIFLNCIRYTIEAGGMAITLPKFGKDVRN